MTAEQLYDSLADIDETYISEATDTLPKRNGSVWIKIACCITVILALGAWLSQTPLLKHGFYIAKQDEQYFLRNGFLPTTNSDTSDTMLNCEAWHGVHFDSVEEMRDDFLNYQFTESEIAHIEALLERHNGLVPIPDLSRLCKPVLPDDVSTNGRVQWSGSASYSFSVSCNNIYRLSMNTITKSHFEETPDSIFNLSVRDRLEVIHQEQIEDRNATLYRTRSPKNGHISEFIFYTLTDGDKTIYVYESYYQTGYSPENLSAFIKMYIQDDDRYAYVYMDNYEIRPTMEWLLSFGLEKLPE